MKTGNTKMKCEANEVFPGLVDKRKKTVDHEKAGKKRADFFPRQKRAVAAHCIFSPFKFFTKQKKKRRNRKQGSVDGMPKSSLKIPCFHSLKILHSNKILRDDESDEERHASRSCCSSSSRKLQFVSGKGGVIKKYTCSFFFALRGRGKGADDEGEGPPGAVEHPALRHEIPQNWGGMETHKCQNEKRRKKERNKVKSVF